MGRESMLEKGRNACNRSIVKKNNAPSVIRLDRISITHCGVQATKKTPRKA
jgi:hypothetical protein